MKLELQQGDVLFFKASELPQNLKKAKVKDGKYVLAEGESTGHAHVMEAGAGVMYEDDSKALWLKVDKTADVVHEEHKAVTLDPGVYKIGIVREVDPFSEEIKKVTD